jgi:apolipoprotein D and lipocalin family protein
MRTPGWSHLVRILPRLRAGTLLLLLPFLGCTGLPEGVRPVGSFQAERYLGRWYEIARLDHGFERGLIRVTADYSLRPDGGLRVVNAGQDARTGKWKRAEGKAYFVQDPREGWLKVSFFGPFYASYVVFELDPEYRYALVAGPDRSYLWLLSRTPALEPARVASLLARAEALGFDTHRVLRVDQTPAGVAP